MKHFQPDGSCDCLMTGICFECKKPCKEHDLAGDEYLCEDCLEKFWNKNAEELPF